MKTVLRHISRGMKLVALIALFLIIFIKDDVMVSNLPIYLMICGIMIISTSIFRCIDDPNVYLRHKFALGVIWYNIKYCNGDKSEDAKASHYLIKNIKDNPNKYSFLLTYYDETVNHNV